MVWYRRGRVTRFQGGFEGDTQLFEVWILSCLLQYHTRVSTSKGIEAIPEIAEGDQERG